MDERQSNPYDSGSGLAATGMPPDKKKILIIGAIALFVIVVAVFVFLSSGRSSSPNPTGVANLSPTVSQKTSQSPTIVAKSFYDWYVNHPSPVKSGAYLTREDVTPDFKETMGIFVSRGIDPGYDHVFCDALPSLPKNVTPNEPIYSEGRVALIIFRDSNENNLFQMWLENIEGDWYVSDASCVE